VSDLPEWVENLHRDLKGAISTLNFDLNHLIDVPIDERLAKIRLMAESLDSHREKQPRRTPEIFIREWNDYLRGAGPAPEGSAIRQLCWEPDVASTTEFLRHLKKTSPEMNPKSIRGLVYSFHARWTKAHRESESLDHLRYLITTYSGTNTWINAWKKIPGELAGEDAPGGFARLIVDDMKDINASFKDRNVFVQTEFHQAVIDACVKVVLENLSDTGDLHILSEKINYLQTVLFPHSDLSPKTFKNGVGRLILHKCLAQNPNLIDMVRDFVIRSRMLGDPRLSHNGVRWAGVDERAKATVIEWLSKADIIFFFDNIMPPGGDRQGRKDFWLNYVKCFTRTRCLLGSDDNARLTPIFRRHQGQIEGYGRISGQERNSAFMLDFGPVLAIEYSRVGACYLYHMAHCPQQAKEFWSTKPFTEAGLKNRDLCVERIPHISNWQFKLSSTLARLGIRPKR